MCFRKESLTDCEESDFPLHPRGAAACSVLTKLEENRALEIAQEE